MEKKLTSISTSFSPTSLDIPSQISCHSIYIIFFAIYFPGSSPLLNSFSSTQSNFSCCLTFALNFPLNSSTASFVFSKSFSFFQMFNSAVNLFHYTKYFITSLIFLLFSIFSTSYSLTFSTSTSFTSSIFCLSTCSLTI